MLTTHGTSPIHFKNDDDKKMAFEQYKILFESMNKLHETRENANNFWIGSNGLAVSILAYLRDAPQLTQPHKHFLIWTVIMLGFSLSLGWLSYLKTLKNSLVVRGNILVSLEKNFPIPIFSEIFSLPSEKVNKAALTQKEMIVPLLFLAGYLFFAVLLFFFTDEVIATVSQVPAS